MEVYWRPFLELCFPTIAGGIDWTVPVEFLDQELQEIVRDADLGKQRVDKLAKVRRTDGTDEWVLVHVEVQSQADEGLPLRLYQYHHRIVDRFGRRCATLAVLADEREDWRPECYEAELWGCRIRFEFPVCKLLDLAGDAEGMAAGGNPAAVVVSAHLAAQSTRGDMDLRGKLKWELTRRLYERGYERRDVLELFRLIDWLLRLPEGLEVALREQIVSFEEDKAMPYITSIERIGRQEGLAEGRLQALREDILDILEIRFGTVPGPLKAMVDAATEETRLKSMHRHAVQIPSLDQFQAQFG